MRVRGVRGATTAHENTKESILEATQDLLERLVEANAIDVDDIASALFTSTEDLDTGFPAEAARRMGWQYVALLGASEVPVPGAPGRCIRVLLMVNTDKPPQDLQFVYIRGAAALREGSPGSG